MIRSFGISKFIDLFNDTKQSKYDLMFFIAYQSVSQYYRSRLVQDGDSDDEIYEQMLIYTQTNAIDKKAKLFLYADEFVSAEYTFKKKYDFDLHTKQQQDIMFLNAIEYAFTYNYGRKFDLSRMIRLYVKFYSIPKLVYEKIIKATLMNDAALSELYKAFL